MKVHVQFEYLEKPHSVTIESTVHPNEDGKIDEYAAKILISVVLSHIPSKRVCVRNVHIASEKVQLFEKDELCYYHIGENKNK